MPAKEVERIKNGEAGGDLPAGGELLHVTATCSGNAAQVLRGTQDVLLSVLHALEGFNPTREHLLAQVPEWFRNECAPEEIADQSLSKIERRRSLSLAERVKEEQEEKWSLGEWLHWFTDEERQWQWWGARVVTPAALDVTIAIKEWPVPVASLEWMLRASGATEVQFDY